MHRELLLISLVAALGCRPAVDRPNVFLITLDTLRADRLGCYGSLTTRTPHLDALASEGLLFENAASPLPETLPSHATIFTSLYPREHGVVSNSEALDPAVPTVTESFVDGGFLTAGFAGCALFAAASGAQRGFAHFDVSEEPQRPARRVVAAALRWLEDVDPAQPVFVWVHLFDPHAPYEPPAPFDRPRDDGSLTTFTWPQLLAIADAHQGEVPAAVLERAEELYDGEVEATDDALGVLFDGLRRRGRWDDSVVLLVGDHGECFENGIFFEHSPCLYDGAIAVPLLLRAPGKAPAGARVRSQVELNAIAPTLLRLAGLPVAASFGDRDLVELAERPPGRSFAFLQPPYYSALQVRNRSEVLRRLRAVGGVPTRPLFADRLQVGVRSAEWKYLRVGEHEELYRLPGDPGESRNVADDHPEKLEELRRLAADWLLVHPLRPPEPAALNPELEENLRALGYL